MSLISVANQFYRQVKVASGDNYKKLLKVQELAQAAAIDPYGEYSSEEMSYVQKLLKTISILTDKVYRSGIDASHLKYFIDNAKSQILKINIAASEPVKSQMTKLMNAINEIQIADIQSQMSGNTAQVMPESTVTARPPASGSEEPKGGLTPEMENVVTQQVEKNRSPTDKYDFNHRPVRWY